MSGTVGDGNESTAQLAISLNQEWGGSPLNRDEYVPQPGGFYLDYSTVGTFPLQLEIADDDGNVWCTRRIQQSGTSVPFESLLEECWLGDAQPSYNYEEITHIKLVVPGTTGAATPYSFCLNGLWTWTDSVCDNSTVTMTADGIVDDFDNGGLDILMADGAYTGFWIAAGDDATGGTQTITVEEQDGNPTLHVVGSGYEGWGSFVGSVWGPQACLNAASFTGIAFDFKGISATDLYLKVGTAATFPSEYGGDCAADCYDHHRYLITPSAAFVNVQVPWTALTQNGFGTPADFDPHRILRFEFAPDPDTTNDYDFWIDNIRFY